VQPKKIGHQGAKKSGGEFDKNTLAVGGREGGVNFKGWEEQPDFEEKNDYHFGWLLFLHLHEMLCVL